jgi:hypothetical protein
MATASTAVGNDLSTSADASTDEATLQTSAASLQSDAQAIQGDPAPSCVPGLRADLAAGAGYYSTSAIDATNCLNQLSAGNTTVAIADLQAANTQITSGNTKLAAAVADVKTFNGQG